MRPTVGSPIRIALIDDYDVVLIGLANMLSAYRDRIQIVEMDANEPLATKVDIALLDSFALSDANDQIGALVRSDFARRVVVYTWTFHPESISAARQRGVDGYISKTLPARELVDALEAVHAGRVVVSGPPAQNSRSITGLDWPGRSEGLTDREAEILALITQGKSNAQVAAATYLAPNTVKSYIRSLYRKIGIESRTQAVLWGVRHGFTPDHDRVDLVRGQF